MNADKGRPHHMTARGGELGGWRRVLVPATLALSFLANDGEELVTMAATWRDSLDRVPRPFRRWLRDRPVSQSETTVAICLVGVLVTIAAADGYRSRGRGRLYQNVQLVFGMHGFTHIAASLITRGYTSGVTTSPTVVIPQLLWARHMLRASGVPWVGSLRHGLPVVLAWLLMSHAIAQGLTRATRTPK